MLDAAGKAGLLSNLPGFEDFGLTPKEDYDNIQPRVGFAYDLSGNGRDLIRAGYGRYFDFGYTNSNILFAAIDATGIGAGTVFEVNNASGIRNPNGSFFQVADPIQNIQSQNEAGGALPLNRHVASPRIKQPGLGSDCRLAGRISSTRPRCSTWTTSAREARTSRGDLGSTHNTPATRSVRCASSGSCRARRISPSPSAAAGSRVRRRQLRRAPPDESWSPALGVVFAVEVVEHDRQQR